MPATIKCTWKELELHAGLTGVECIAIPNLGKYGFTDEIINNMIKFDIFPQAYHICGMTYVSRRAIFQGFVQKMLENSMTLYQGVADLDAMDAKVKAYIEDNALTLTPDVIAKIQSGEVTLEELAAKADDAPPIFAEPSAPEQPETTEESA